MFIGNGPDGYIPVAGLVFDAAGNLYGTTSQDGNMNCSAVYGGGVAFRLTPNSDGTWTKSLLNIFCSTADCVIPRHGCIPAEPASVSPGEVIVAPSRPSVSTSGVPVTRDPTRTQRTHA
jgi:hypothetical protein